MIHVKDIDSLTAFQRNTKEHLRRLKKSRRPMVLTVNGKAELVVQDAESYQHLAELAERAEAIAGIRRGLEDVRHGKTKPARQVLDEMRKEFKIPRRA